MRHHTWPIFVFLVETGFQQIGQAGLELLTLWFTHLSLPTCDGVSHHAQPQSIFDKGAKIIQWEKDSFFQQMTLRKLSIHMQSNQVGL